jgi:uncharacterized protein YutE (UPF0331/DUF86 family)
VVDEQRVADLLVAAEAYLADVRRFRDASDADSFATDVGHQYRVEFPLQQAIQRCTDLAAHWLADAAGHRPATSAGLFLELAQRQLLPRELAQRLAAMARFRNLLVHEYGEVDPVRVWEIVRDDLGDVDAFLAAVAAELG